MPEQAKRKVSVTLDADLVDALAAQGGGLSSRVNDAVRRELARLRRHEALGALLDRTHPGERTVRRALTTAHRLGREVVVPTVVLAELFRGSRTASGSFNHCGPQMDGFMSTTGWPGPGCLVAISPTAGKTSFVRVSDYTTRSETWAVRRS